MFRFDKDLWNALSPLLASPTMVGRDGVTAQALAADRVWELVRRAGATGAPRG